VTVGEKDQQDFLKKTQEFTLTPGIKYAVQTHATSSHPFTALKSQPLPVPHPSPLPTFLTFQP
jgi:hypothetical protein